MAVCSHCNVRVGSMCVRWAHPWRMLCRARLYYACALTQKSTRSKIELFADRPTWHRPVPKDSLVAKDSLVPKDSLVLHTVVSTCTLHELVACVLLCLTLVAFAFAMNSCSACVSQTFGVVCVCICYQVPVIFQHALRITRMESRANVRGNWCAPPLTAHVSIHLVHARHSRNMFWSRRLPK